MSPILVLTGPTAAGKTELSLALAEHLDAEIISADSRQIYRELSVGTAKPPEEVLRRLPHHFIDELSLPEVYSAGRFQEDACARISEIHARGRTAIVVGGSTLYIHALKHGLANIPEISSDVRERIMHRLRTEGAHALYGELVDVDAESARTMDPSKTQRLVRALEVFAATGRPLSSYHKEQAPPPFPFRTVVLNRDRHELYARINERVDQMLEHGLLEEVRRLRDHGFDRSLNPLRTIGYQEPLAYLEGEISRDEMVRLIKRNTRRYAKRQLTWFRRDPENVWLDAAAPKPELLKRILALVSAAQARK